MSLIQIHIGCKSCNGPYGPLRVLPSIHRIDPRVNRYSLVLMGLNMLNKIVFLIFVGTISIASTAALASDDRTQHNSTKSLTIVNAASSESFEKQMVNSESSETQNTLSQASDNGNTVLPGTGWLLGIALFGFVMLSNRSSI
jgi:hypothetical protein